MTKIICAALLVLGLFVNVNAQTPAFPDNLLQPCNTNNQQLFSQPDDVAFIFEKNKNFDSLLLQHFNLISSDSIISYITGLQNLGTRYAYADNRRQVAEWIKSKFISFGYPQTHLDSFLYQGLQQYNVIATLQGSVNPNVIYILGGHHDAITYTNPMVFAPGADDNGTAVATALEVARVMNVNGYQPTYSIQFMTFGAEEVGLKGSIDYATKAALANKDIRMMVNTDMTGSEPSSNNWLMNFQNYQGCEYVTSLGHFIAQNYCNITPVNVNSNSASSDSYPFWTAGYQTIFLQEYNFSPYYHTNNDVVANINGPYCAEIARLACGMLLHAIETPAKVANLRLFDVGNGNQILAKWNASVEPDVVQYKLFVGEASGTYDTVFYTTDTAFIVSELTENTKYYIGVAAVDSENSQGLVVEKNIIPQSIPLAPSNLSDISGNQNIKISWNRNKEMDLAGYNIYRGLQSGQNNVKINETLVYDSVFTDTAIMSYCNYYYIVKAVDNLNNESSESNEVLCRKVSLDKGILVIDDSEGGLLSPSDEQVDIFYTNLLSNFEVVHFDAIDSQRILLADLADYTALVWHSQNSQSNGMLYKRLPEVAKYLNAGGKILFTLDRPSRAFDFNTTNYPYSFNAQHFVNQYCGITHADKQGQARFIGANANSLLLQDIYIDTLKTPAVNLHHISNIEAIYPIDSANIIFSYDSHYGTGTTQGSMIGQPVGIKNFNSTYQLIVLSFPLYYMQFEQAKVLVDSLLHEQMQVPLNVGKPVESSLTTAPLFHIYPNPVSDRATIKVISNMGLVSTIAIYNNFGEKVVNLPVNNNTNVVDMLLSFQQYKPGLYFCVVTTEKGSYAYKFLVAPVK